MKLRYIITLLFSLSTSLLAICQQDTIVLRDYTNIFITVDADGEAGPVTDYSRVEKAGFFLNEIPEGTFRVCNDETLYLWVDGRLIDTIEGCKMLEPEVLFEYAPNDSIFVSFSTYPRFQNFICELVILGDLKVVKDEVSRSRHARNTFHEFCITAILTLLMFFGIFASSFPSRFGFFVGKTFSLKASAYQFTNTGFFSRPNVAMILILSLTAGFEIIYVDEMLSLTKSRTPDFTNYLVQWLTAALWICGFFGAKRVLTQMVSGLFQMRRLRDWQLFDLVNFSGYFVMVLFIIVLWDFVLKGGTGTWINDTFSYYFIAVLLLFALWFIIKFVINSSYQKLLIISYLCATEIIPSLLIMVWFLK